MNFIDLGEQIVLDGRIYLKAIIPLSIKKLIMQFTLEEIPENGHVRISQNEITETQITAQGEYIEDCVMRDATSVALFLGMPIRKIRLDIEQPYLTRENARERYEHPYESIFPELADNGGMNNK